MVGSNKLIAPIIISTESLFVQVSSYSLVITTDGLSIKGQILIVFFFLLKFVLFNYVLSTRARPSLTDRVQTHTNRAG